MDIRDVSESYRVEYSRISHLDSEDPGVETTYHIFQTRRCTFFPKFGRKMGVRLIVWM